MIELDNTLKNEALKVARDIADWICSVQSPWISILPDAGGIPFSVEILNHRIPAPNWCYSFVSMGLASAYEVFKDEKYKIAQRHLIKVLSTFQIFDPFNKKHYGAIREYTSLAPWCFTRDALSGGWGMLEYYKFTKDKQYLERAEIFGNWLIKEGLDEEGYPWFGVWLDETIEDMPKNHIENDIQGNFQGGSLNFFYKMYKTTGDKKWCQYMKPIADIFCDYIQQDSGYFASVDRKTKKPLPSNDTYVQLHRGNDDFGTLGLLGAYNVFGEKKYLNSIEKFLTAVWKNQRKDGFFEDSVAASPVILNITWQVRDLIKISTLTNEKFRAAIVALLSAQCDSSQGIYLKGALRENVSNPVEATMRANQYSLILLLKLFAQKDNYL
jgi:uncharacterized protein YyaL (SSP411 family)